MLATYPDDLKKCVLTSGRKIVKNLKHVTKN